MHDEHDCGENVVVGPVWVVSSFSQEAVKFQSVDVTHLDRLHTLIRGPEQLQLGDATEENEVWWWPERIFFRGSKSELEQVNSHENQKHHTSHAQVEVAIDDGSLHTKLVPCFGQTCCDMEQCREQDVLLNNVCRKPKSGPVQPHIEVAVTIEVIRASKHMQVANSMDNNEQDKKDGTACQSNAISGIDLEVFVAE